MSDRLIRRLPRQERLERNKRIAAYADVHPQLSYKQLGQIFKLSAMTIYGIVGPRPEKKEQHYCDKCGHAIPAPLPEPGDLPLGLEGGLSLAQVSE